MKYTQRQTFKNVVTFSDSTEGVFQGDERCLSFALSADGFDPFNHQKVQYSMCPVLLKCLNFNHLSRDKIGRMLLSSIVPGNNTFSVDFTFKIITVFLLLDKLANTSFERHIPSKRECHDPIICTCRP